MEHCDRFIDLISRSLDESLSPQDQQDLDGHLRQCPQCRELACQLAQIREELDSWEPQPVPEGFAQGVMDRVRNLEQEKKLIPLWKRPQVRALGSLAACLLLFVGVLRLGTVYSETLTASPAFSQPSDIAGDSQSPAASPALEESRAAAEQPAASSQSSAACVTAPDSYDSTSFSAGAPAQADGAEDSSTAVQYAAAGPQSLSKSASTPLPDSDTLLQYVESALDTTPGTLLVVEEIPEELEGLGSWYSTEDGFQFLALEEAPEDGQYQTLVQDAALCLVVGDGPFVLLLWS